MRKSAKMEVQRHTRDPNGCQKGSQVTPRCSKGSPKVPQGVPKDLKKSEKAPQSDPHTQNKVDTFSKPGFVHRRSVFEPPKLKVDYHCYTSGALEKLSFSKQHENTINTMLLGASRTTCLSMGTGSAFQGGESTHTVQTELRNM